jgi:hypothetical protein
VIRDAADLDTKSMSYLASTMRRLQVSCTLHDRRDRFRELIREAERLHGQRVVILVDEYDKPIRDNLTHPEIAREIRDGLRDLYSVVKDSDAHIRFAMLTGMSKFSNVSLFSGLNNLNDITLDARYSAICGYTDEDVGTVFASELAGLDRDEIRAWYNGYNWEAPRYTTRSTCCCCFRSVNSVPTGSRQERRPADGPAYLLHRISSVSWCWSRCCPASMSSRFPLKP